MVASAFSQAPPFISGQATGIQPIGSGLIPISYGQVRVCTLPGAVGSPCTPLAPITDTFGNPLTVSGGNFGQLSTNVVGQFSFGCTAGTSFLIQIQVNTSNTPELSYPLSCPGGGGGGGGGSITGATPGGGLVVSSTTLGLLTSCSSNQVLQWNGSAWVCSTISGAGTGILNSVAFWQTTTGLGSVTTAIAGQTLISTGTTPTFASQGLPGGNGATGTVSASTYLVQCDSGSSVLDRLSTILFTNAAGTAVTLPDPSTLGCSSNFAIILGGGVGSGTVTVSRGTSATFTVLTGSAASGGATTFTLTAGQYAMVSSPDNVNWVVREVTGSGGGGSPAFSAITSGTNTAMAGVCASGCSITTTTGGVVTGTGLSNAGNTAVLNGTGISITDVNTNNITMASGFVGISAQGGGAGLGGLTLSVASGAGNAGAADLSDGSGDALILGASAGTRPWKINLSNSTITSAYLNTTSDNTFIFGSPLAIGTNATPGTTAPAIAQGLTITTTGTTMTGELTTAAATTSSAGLNVPHGTAPTTPVNGDFWSTSAGFFGRVLGVTVGPFAAAGTTTFPATVAGTVNSGGVPCFTSTTTEASSATLNSNAVVVGGGSGVCPSASSVTVAGNVATFPNGTSTAPSIVFSNSSTFGFYSIDTADIGLGTGSSLHTSTEFKSSGTIKSVNTGVYGFSTSSSDATATMDTGWDRAAASVMELDAGTQGTEGGLIRLGLNSCRVTSAVTLSTAATTICTWSLPALAKTWAWQCSGTYSITAGTTPAFGLGMNASQTPTETGNASINTTLSGTSTQGSATATTSGNQSILTGGTLTTITSAPWSSSGTIQASATAGTFAITGILTGTTPAGTVNVGSTCYLY